MSRVFIADDHPLIQDAVRSLLTEAGHEIAGSAASVDETVARFPKAGADLLLLDLQMPDGSGLQVVRSLRTAGSEVRSFLYTARIGDEALRDALALGVGGVLLKTSNPRLLLEGVGAVSNGQRWIDPELKERVEAMSARGGNPRPLSDRERQLIGLVGEGLTNKEIAGRLNTTEGTVKMYLHSLFDKVGVATRTELAMRAADLT